MASHISLGRAWISLGGSRIDRRWHPTLVWIVLGLNVICTHNLLSDFQIGDCLEEYGIKRHQHPTLVWISLGLNVTYSHYLSQIEIEYHLEQYGIKRNWKCAVQCAL